MSARSRQMWAHSEWPTENGGHTYCGFFEVRPPSRRGWGIVRPDVPENFALIAEATKQVLRLGFEGMGYRIEA